MPGRNGMEWTRRLAMVTISLLVVSVFAAVVVNFGPRSGRASASTARSTPIPGPVSRASALGPAGGTGSAPGSVLSAPSALLPPPASVSDPARIVTPGVDAPDPFVIAYEGTYYLYASQDSASGPSVPVRTSSSLTRWGPVTDAMPAPPAWVEKGFTWSPDVRQVGKVFVMWFSAALVGHDPVAKCIGVATASSPLGPFVGASRPAICQLDHNGSIDPRTFQDANGSLWIDWKSDDNADVASTSHSSIYAQRLSSDGTVPVGTATVILTADQAWEGRIVEAPQMVRDAGHYWLFYSGNWFNEPYYAVGVAECQGPAGPCHKYLDHPWLASNAQGQGPGEASLFTDHTGTWIFYSPFAVRYRTYTVRPVALARVAFGPFGPYLAAL
ncbi:MAG: glycoside hydrolase family 43 protein [Acidimicrobiales bacterium]